MAAQTLNEPKAEAAQAETKTREPLLWRTILIAGGLTGVLWTAVLWFGGSSLQLLAGVVPVFGGIYLGRKIKGRALAHGSLMSLVSVLAASALILPLVFTSQVPTLFNDPNVGTLGPGAALISIGMFMLVSLVPFPIYGALISKRGQHRNDELRKQNEARGGSLRNPGRVVNLDDLQALPLDKFGTWVGRVFTDQDFTMIDYKFDKDFVDLKLQRKDPEEQWLVRCTVVEAVKPGMVQSLGQDVREGEYAKGVVATSTVVQDGARKWAKTRRNIEVLDGETLIEIKG